MSKRINWSSNVKAVTNPKGDTRYFVQKCDQWVRVSKKAYQELCGSANRQDCMLTRTIKKNFHHSKTISGVYFTK